MCWLLETLWLQTKELESVTIAAYGEEDLKAMQENNIQIVMLLMMTEW